MIRTPVCDLLQIEHPIALGGMGSIYAPDLVAAVSNAGGLGAMGCHYLRPEQVRAGAAAIRELSNKPFALNFLVFDVNEDAFAEALALHPAVIALAWPWRDQDLKPYIDVVLSAFGPKRLMYGSDWPVMLLAGEYVRWYDVVTNAISKLSKAEQERIMSGTAIEAYGL